MDIEIQVYPTLTSLQQNNNNNFMGWTNSMNSL